MSEPRGQCLTFMSDKVAEEMTLEEFNKYINLNQFVEGPFRDNFGDGYGEPYEPRRQIFGVIRCGQAVYAELAETVEQEVGL